MSNLNHEIRIAAKTLHPHSCYRVGLYRERGYLQPLLVVYRTGHWHEYTAGTMGDLLAALLACLTTKTKNNSRKP